MKYFIAKPYVRARRGKITPDATLPVFPSPAVRIPRYTVGVVDLATKSHKTVHRPNEKDLTSSVFDDQNRFFTAGYDCSIRLWSR